MSASIHNQADAIRVLSQRLSARHLVKSGAVARQSEADHFILMLKNAAETLSRLSSAGYEP